MSSLHQSDVKAKLARYLERRVMPRHLEGKADATRDELDAMVHRIARAAPAADRLPAWWQRFTDRLDEIATTRAWPSVSEVISAARAAGEGAPLRDMTGDGNPDALFEHRRAARKIKAREPIGDSWLWGRNAVVLLANGLVDAEDIDDLRRMLRRQMVAMWGDEPTDRIIADLDKRHDAARAAYAQHRDRDRYRADTSGMALPDKRVASLEFDA